MNHAIVRMRLGFLAPAVLAVLPGANLMAQSETDRGVARISLMHGDVSVKRGDSGEWTAAAVNAPLVVGDQIFTGVSSRAEVQFDYSNMIRMSSDAEVRLAELEYRRYQIQLAKGLVTFRVLRDIEADAEVATPTVSVRPVKKGTYRIFVRPDGATEITVRSGEVEIFTPQGSERLKSGKTMLVRGTRAQPEVQVASAQSKDDWDRWNERRDDDLLRSRSYQYVSNDVYGADDLDAHGRWVYQAPYGWCWTPYVAAGWAPYRYGRWGWVDYYGWSWISYDPWGWAPYHYGRWFHNAGYGWCWWPGGYGARAYWSPGLVAFVGWSSWSGFSFGVGVGVGFGHVGWVPLAPYEPYHRWYGHGYYGGYRNKTYIDNSVKVVNNVNITNIYKNSRVNNSITTVDGESFVRGRGGNYRPAPAAELRRASLVEGQVPLAPQRSSLRFADVSPRTFESSPARDGFVSRRQAAAVDRVPFEQQQRVMEDVSRRAMAANNSGGRGEGSGTGAPAARENSAGSSTGRGSIAETRGGNTRVLGDGSRVTGEPVERGVRGGETRVTEGWRRFGEPIGTEEAAGRGASSQTQGRGWRQESESGSVRGNSGTGRGSQAPANEGGWRRFGEPMRGREGFITRGESRSDSGSTPESIGRGETGALTDSGGGWRGLGSRRTATETVRENPVFVGGGENRGGRGDSDAPSRSSSGWRGLGTAREDSSSGVERNPSVDSEGSRGYGRGGSSRRGYEPGRGESRGSESIRMNPSVLQERRQVAPQREAGFGSGDAGFGRSRGGYEPRGDSGGYSRGGYSGMGGRGDSGGFSGGSRGGYSGMGRGTSGGAPSGGFGGGSRGAGGAAPSMGSPSSMGGGGGSRGGGDGGGRSSGGRGR